ncbi:hypothetical protein WME91_39305 [Sorangium sp. So ce269]
MHVKPVDVVRKLGQAWNKHDLDTVYGLLHEDYREHSGDMARALGMGAHEKTP